MQKHLLKKKKKTITDLQGIMPAVSISLCEEMVHRFVVVMVVVAFLVDLCCCCGGDIVEVAGRMMVVMRIYIM